MTEILSSLAGTVIGAAVAIVTIHLQFRNQRRQEAQKWYQDTYIAGGIDHVISSLVHWRLYFMGKSIGNSPITENASFPIDSILRTGTILGIDLWPYLTFLHAGPKEGSPPNAYKSFDVLTVNAIGALSAARKQMLAVHVRTKADIYSLSEDRVVHSAGVQLDEALEKLIHYSSNN